MKLIFPAYQTRRVVAFRSVGAAIVISRFIACMLVTAGLSVAPADIKAAAQEQKDATHTVRSTEQQLQVLYQKVSPAVVRFASDENGKHSLSPSGVIISPEGHIATIAQTQIFNDHTAVFCFLTDGRHAKCEPLGWSAQWNVGLLKIRDPGNWPHVPLNDKPIRAGQFCAALDYEYDSQTQSQKRSLDLRVGSITSCAPQIWLTASCRVDEWPPLFSLDGELIGITSRQDVDYDIHATRAELLQKHWALLTAGKNLDREIVATDSKSADSKTASTRPQENDPASDEVKAAIAKATAATVRLRLPQRTDGTGRWSGVIVSPDGYIATIAHHLAMPGEAVSVELADGRNAAGKILGVDRVADTGLVKIVDQGDWPHVEMGASVSMTPGAPCWCIGFPASRKKRTPLVRQSNIVEAAAEPSARSFHLLYTSKDIRLFGGDSGGGAFDAQGRLIGNFEGQGENKVARYHRIEILRGQWDFLSAGQPVEELSGQPLGEISEAFKQIGSRNLSAVVEVFEDRKPCALGTIVASDGKIVTKASELYGAISVRLFDGRSFPATIQKRARDHDLALLVIAARDLPVLAWANDEPANPGKMVAALVPGEAPHVGVVSYMTRAIPGRPGAGLVELAQTKRGVEVVDDSSARELGMLIRKGDLIRRIEGHEIPDLNTAVSVGGDRTHPGTLDIYPGDPMTVTVERNNATVELRFPRPPIYYWTPSRNENHRYMGFPEVFDVDAPLKAKQCGGPVLDIDGRSLGVTIAVRGDGWRPTHTHVIPAAVVKRFIPD